jgi:hypothetical protein
MYVLRLYIVRSIRVHAIRMAHLQENLEVGSSAESEIRRIRRVGCASGYTGKEDWSIHDFVGRYHARRVEKNDSRIATPGTTIAVENERRDRELARVAKRKQINKDLKLKAKVRRKRIEQSKRALKKIKENYGFRRQIKEIDLLLDSIDEAAKTYVEMKVPNYLDPKYTGKPEELLPLEGRQKEFAHAVIENHCIDVHRFILGGYKDCDIVLNNNDTLLTFCVRNARLDMLKILIEEGKANPNFPNNYGYGPLFFLYEEWRKQRIERDPKKESLKNILKRANDMANMLLENGGNVNARGVYGETPVHLAAGFGDATLLFTLVRYQFDPTIIDGLGNTALDVAIKQQHLECAIVLYQWPKIRREVSLGFFVNEWKPFLLDKLRHINKTPGFTEILEQLALIDRVRENKRIERLNELGTTIRFYAEDDNAEDATKAGAHLGEQGMQSLKEMKRAMMISEKKMGNKELEQELKKKQKAAKYQVGRKLRRRRRGGKSVDDESQIVPLTYTQQRRKSTVAKLMTGWREGKEPPKTKGDIKRLQRPLRNATSSVLFRPKRTEYALLYRASRASNLPLFKARTRQNERNRLEKSLALPTHSDLEVEATRQKDLEFKALLEDSKPKSAMLPDTMLPPPPSAAALKAHKAMEQSQKSLQESESSKSLLQTEMEEEATRKLKHVPRSWYPGIRGQTSQTQLNKTWRQSVYSLELKGWKDNRDMDGYYMM